MYSVWMKSNAADATYKQVLRTDDFEKAQKALMMAVLANKANKGTKVKMVATVPPQL